VLPATVTVTVTGIPAQAVRLVIEGPVEALTADSVTIFGLVLLLNPAEPQSAALRVGDVVRIDAAQAEGRLRVVTLTFVNVGVFVNEAGDIFRDDGDCANPPPPWAPAEGWRRRCAGGGNPGGGRPGGGNPGGGQGRGGDDDDDDDDDDD
jgi:hypothetical protein